MGCRSICVNIVNSRVFVCFFTFETVKLGIDAAIDAFASQRHEKVQGRWPRR